MERTRLHHVSLQCPQTSASALTQLYTDKRTALTVWRGEQPEADSQPRKNDHKHVRFMYARDEESCWCPQDLTKDIGVSFDVSI